MDTLQAEQHTTALQKSTLRISVLVAACVALNLSLNKIAFLLQLPVFMDTVGTILAAAVLPPFYAILVGITTNIVAGFTSHPVYPFYIGTQIIISLMAIWAIKKGLFNSLWKALSVGLAIGIVSAVVSAPVTVLVFGGITAPGVSLLNAVFLASGHSIWTSVLSGSIIVSSIDKIIAAGLAWGVLKRMPRRFTNRE